MLVAHTVLPENVRIGEELGKGSNNKVCVLSLDDDPHNDFVIRMPRRKSDTQQTGNSLWECRHTIRAVELGVAPEVKTVWIARHSKHGFASGLYMIMSRFQYDLDDVMIDKPELRSTFLKYKETIVSQVIHCLKKLADDHMFVYDLKPSNVVITMEDDTPVVKIIDFGRDFCEWGGLDVPDANTPVISMLKKRIACDRSLEPQEVHELVSHLLFAAMMVGMSSTTTYRLYNERRDHRMSSKERREVNIFAPYVKQLLESMQGRNKDLLREMLRLDDVKNVFRHYHGRRNAGTRRTLLFAEGYER